MCMGRILWGDYDHIPKSAQSDGLLPLGFTALMNNMEAWAPSIS